jgi:drug/metabolite transporter (DMT)-like permease
VLGVAGLFLSTQLSYVGIAYTTAANAAILQSTAPVMVALGAAPISASGCAGTSRSAWRSRCLGVLVVITDGRLWMLRLDDLRAGDFVTLVSLIAWDDLHRVRQARCSPRTHRRSP